MTQQRREEVWQKRREYHSRSWWEFQNRRPTLYTLQKTEPISLFYPLWPYRKATSSLVQQGHQMVPYNQYNSPVSIANFAFLTLWHQIKAIFRIDGTLVTLPTINTRLVTTRRPLFFTLVMCNNTNACLIPLMGKANNNMDRFFDPLGRSSPPLNHTIYFIRATSRSNFGPDQ